MSRIQPLTSLRFFAAMLVVFHHHWKFEAGYVGVGFFFVLSGYVLAINYDGKVSNWEERRDFWFKRFARIYPLYLLTLLLVMPVVDPWDNEVPVLFLLQSWIPSEHYYFAGNGPSWSISNEAFFYAVFPWLLGVRWQTLALWGLGLIALALFFESHWLFYIFPPTRLFEFALGIALARTSGRTGGIHEVAAMAFAAVSLAVIPYLKPSFGLTLAFIPASAALVYVFSRSQGPVSKWLSNRWLVLLGDASFALYMIHWPVRAYLGHYWWSEEVAFALALVGSVFLYLVFEKPVQRWLNARWIEAGWWRQQRLAPSEGREPETRPTTV